MPSLSPPPRCTQAKPRLQDTPAYPPPAHQYVSSNPNSPLLDIFQIGQETTAVTHTPETYLPPSTRLKRAITDSISLSETPAPTNNQHKATTANNNHPTIKAKEGIHHSRVIPSRATHRSKATPRSRACTTSSSRHRGIMLITEGMEVGEGRALVGDCARRWRRV